MKPNRRVIVFWIISAAMGATCTIVAVRFWWPAWIVLAAWFVFLAAMIVVLPDWWVRLLNPRQARTDVGTE